MKNAIVEKVRGHLAEAIDTECKVVYLLCEVRKLLHQHKPTPDLFALRMYCHWALHVDLSLPRTTMPFLQKVDSYIFDKFNTPETNATLVAEHAIFREFVYFETFRKELAQYLSGHGVPATLCSEDERWYTFLAAYAGVIEDGSLTCVGKEPDKLKIISKVTFKKSARQTRRTADGHVPFGIEWDILLKDQKQVEIEVGTQANHKLMHWGLRFIPE